MNPLNAVGLIRERLSEYGLGYGLISLVRLLCVRLKLPLQMHCYVLTAQPVGSAPLVPVRRRGSRTIIREVSQSEYQSDWFPRPQHIIDHRFALNAVCFVAFHDELPVGCIWLAPGHYDEDMLRCRFVPSPAKLTAWDFDVYISPEHRGIRTFAYLWDAANAWMQARGIRWSVSRVDAFNTPSLRAHARLGARQLGRINFVCIGSWQMTVRARPRLLHLGRSADDIPIVDVVAPHDSPEGSHQDL